MSASDNISPTAHYTGEVWRRNGLSHPWLATSEGRVMFDALHPLMSVSGAVGGPSLETYLLARHLAIDALLERAVERQKVSQVVEIAAGMSPRGWRFANRYGDRLTYVETDLPVMAQRKRRALARIGSLSDQHRVRDLDVLRENEPPDPEGLAGLVRELHPGRGLAIITEGLLGYLPTREVTHLWERFARALARFTTGLYISDLHLGGATSGTVRVARIALAAFVRGGVYFHFADAAEAEERLRACGFATATVRPAARLAELPPASSRSTAHILEASTE